MKSTGETKPLATGAKCATKKISVVVGAVDASRSMTRCLDALAASCDGLDCEIIVVSAGPGNLASTSFDDFPVRFRNIEMPDGTLTPMLWSKGIASSDGDVVALTTAHCFVTAAWARSLLAALENGAAAAGGPMRLAAGASIVDAAIFFLRYSAYLDGPPDGVTRDIAGDNCAYVRSRIPDGSWNREVGFWEVDVNRALAASRNTIVWSAPAVAEFGKSFTMRSIARHRFEHGRLFGRSRVSRGESRARIAGSAPLVPFVILARIARRIRGHPEYRRRFITAVPCILALAACWASGEAAGAIDGPIADRR